MTIDLHNFGFESERCDLVIFPNESSEVVVPKISNAFDMDCSSPKEISSSSVLSMPVAPWWLLLSMPMHQHP